jgi:Ni,Fe-hydrogenase III component G
MDAETTFETVHLLLEDWAERFEIPEPNRLFVYMKQVDDLVPAVVGLRVKKLGYLAALVGIDPGIESEELELLYHFCVDQLMIILRFRIPKANAVVPTLCEIIPSAESFERELREMYGVTVTGLKNPGHLYLPDDWMEGVFPLRKGVDPRIAFQNN